MHSRILAAALVGLAPLVVVAQNKPTAGVQKANGVRVESLASLEFPWGMAYLPDGRLLITEKPGRLRIYSDGKLSAPIENLPQISYREGPSEQGGLLDVAVDPEFSQNRCIYLSYSEEAPQAPPAPADDDPRFGGYLDLKDNRLRGGAVARATLDGNRLTDVDVIWRQVPKTIGRGHFGHRLVFGRDNTLFITSGERMRFDPAQDVRSNLGKVVRINRDGSIPNDNPWLGRATVLRETFAHGLKDPEGAALNPQTGELWSIDHGPQGGDEINIVRGGRDYGWPDVTYGTQYDARQSDGRKNVPVAKGLTARADVEQPIYFWVPSIAPSGMMFYTGDLFPAWKGNLFIGAMVGQALVRLEIKGDRVVSEERLLTERKARVREVRQGPDGAIYLLSGADLLKLTPK